MAEEEQALSQYNTPSLDMSLWSATPTQQWLYPPIEDFYHFFDVCSSSQLDSTCHHSPPPDFASAIPHYSDELGTPHQKEPQDPEQSTIEFSSSTHGYLTEEERFVLNARLKDKPWKLIEEAYTESFNSSSHRSLPMRVSRLKGKYPEVKAILEKNKPTAKSNPTTKNGPITNPGRPVKPRRRKRKTAQTSGADGNAVVVVRDEGVQPVQQVSVEEAIRAVQTMLYFLGRPDCDGLVSPEDCMALVRVLSQLNRLNE
ncbi:hypothetical protein CSUB01_10254 [Colletotrichum sublineola]|uniref:Uncharacterized protein n=1 Tax=Colletotrichum sublineola TaxID=1173701 RepID=A0A066XWC5_COLSU|nr:hypothetical protein CSUB01_10254 [Colletotrichum sublineola]